MTMMQATERIAPPLTGSRPRARRSLRPMLDGIRRDAIDVAGWALLATAVAIWIADHGLNQLTDLASIVTQLGVLSGLIATVLMLEGVLLAARIPVIDKAMGHDHALARHGEVTQWMLVALLGHIVFIIVGYAASAGTGVVAQTLGLLGSSDIVWAAISVGLFVLVGATSIILALRRSLPHELWFGVHVLSYLAIIASIPHQFTSTTMFEHGFARWFWTGLYAFTAFCVLAFRVLRPVTMNLEHRFYVANVSLAASDAVAIVIGGRNLDRLDVQAGQFFNWRFLAPGMPRSSHPFSISAAPDGRSLRITVKSLGEGTRRLQFVEPGTRVWASGPYGRFVPEVASTDAAVLIGSGVGIAPIASVLPGLRTDPRRTLVILRGTTDADLVHVDEIAALCARRGYRLITMPGHRAPDSWLSAGASSFSLARTAPWLADADIWVCGPEQWTELVTSDCVAHGASESHLHTERFAL